MHVSNIAILVACMQVSCVEQSSVLFSASNVQ